MAVPDLIRWLGKCETQGLSVKIHCAGDAAVTQALDAFDVVRSLSGPTKLTHQIAHSSYIAPQDVERFATLGVVADLSPIIWYPTFFLAGHKVAMGVDRAGRFWPNRDLKEAGALMSGCSDWPVIPNPDPWNGVEGLITRRNPYGEFGDATLWPEQALDFPSVLEIYTINGARAMGLEGVTGSIEVGKSADLIVLDRNLFETPAQDLAETKVLTTYFERRSAHERGRSRASSPGDGAHRLPRQRQDDDAGALAQGAVVRGERRHPQRIRRGRARSSAHRNPRGALRVARQRLRLLHGARRSRRDLVATRGARANWHAAGLPPRGD